MPKRVSVKKWGVQEGAPTNPIEKKYVDAEGAHKQIINVLEAALQQAIAYDHVVVEALRDEIERCRQMEHKDARCDVLIDSHWVNRYVARVVRL